MVQDFKTLQGGIVASNEVEHSATAITVKCLNVMLRSFDVIVLVHGFHPFERKTHWKISLHV